MTTWIVAGALGLLASIIAHETGHAYALKTLHIPLHRAGIGLPIPPMLEFAPTERRPWTFTVSWLLLGAYVTPHPDAQNRLDALSYRAAAWYAGAGPLVNVILGTATGVVYGALHEAWIFTTVCAAVCVLACVAPRRFCAYGIPAIGLLAVAAVVWQLFTIPATVSQGPVAVYSLIGESSSADGFLLVLCLLNISLAIFNALPLWPLDGGHIARAAIRAIATEPATKIYQLASFAAFALLVLYFISTDVISAVAG